MERRLELKSNKGWIYILYFSMGIYIGMCYVPRLGIRLSVLDTDIHYNIISNIKIQLSKVDAGYAGLNISFQSIITVISIIVILNAFSTDCRFPISI